MELFRVPLVDLPVIASINRKQWDTEGDFDVAGQQVWLSDEGRKKLITIYERRKSDYWRHPPQQDRLLSVLNAFRHHRNSHTQFKSFQMLAPESRVLNAFRHHRR